MAILFSNNATSRLASSLATNTTSLVLAAGDGPKFPQPDTAKADWFPLTIIKASGALEIVHATVRANDTITIARAREGTAALSFDVGDRVELRLTQAVMTTIVGLISTAQSGADASVKQGGGATLVQIDAQALVSPQIEVGTPAKGGYLDFHVTGGAPDFDVRLSADQASGGNSGGRLVLDCAKGLYVGTGGSITAEGGVNSNGGLTYMAGNVLGMRCADTSNASNMHIWFYNANGSERSLIYADPNSILRFRTAGTERFRIQNDGNVVAQGNVYAGNGNSFFGSDGNVVGPLWGGTLNSHLYNNYLPRGDLMQKYADNGPAGGVGTYAQMVNVSGQNFGPGAIIGGGNLRYGAAGTNNGQIPDGNWRTMGYGANNQASVYLRIS